MDNYPKTYNVFIVDVLLNRQSYYTLFSTELYMDTKILIKIINVNQFFLAILILMSSKYGMSLLCKLSKKLSSFYNAPFVN